MAATKKAADDAFEPKEGFDHKPFVWSDCPACGNGKEKKFAFWKDDYTYYTCELCNSLYMSPRPSSDALAKLYSRLDAFEAFYRASGDARLEAIVRPRANEIVRISSRYGVRSSYCDIGCGSGAILEEVAALGWFPGILGLEPSETLRHQANDRGLVVWPWPLEDSPLTSSVDFATAFEVIEHVFSPAKFLCAARKLLCPSGILMFTTLTVDGWDMSELGQYHKSVCPPLHINLMSMAGIDLLVERCGLELLEMTTPGRLDVDILRNTLEEKPNISVSNFAHRIADLPERSRDDFQEFLSANRLSSHVMVVARARE